MCLDLLEVSSAIPANNYIAWIQLLIQTQQRKVPAGTQITMPPKYGYHQVHDQPITEEEGTNIPELRSPRHAWSRWCIASLIFITNAIAFVMGVLVSQSPLLTSPQSLLSPESSIMIDQTAFKTTALSRASTTTMIDGLEVAGTQCGHNWREAKALGCHFDVMASRWYAPECFDQEVLDDMLAEPLVNSNFTWYADKAHTIVVPPEKVFNGEFDKVYPDNLFHIKHCLHLWRKLHHAILVGRPVDEDILDYGHTLHCTRMVMKWMEPGFERHSVTHAESATPFCRSSLLVQPLGGKR